MITVKRETEHILKKITIPVLVRVVGLMLKIYLYCIRNEVIENKAPQNKKFPRDVPDGMVRSRGVWNKFAHILITPTLINILKTAWKTKFFLITV